jgi:prolyl-tRNA editing enzyme YbaK/EbsC (Cys-tRNA(Pro) deacylase)
MGEEAQIKVSALKVQRALRALGINADVREMPASTRTAKEAAETIGCAVGQIAKSLVFRGETTGKALLIIASGVNRVNEAAMISIVGERLERATPAFVREMTGFAIGGVPPVGHDVPLSTWIDKDLLGYEQVWAAAGTPYAVFPISPADLVRVTGAAVVTV